MRLRYIVIWVLTGALLLTLAACEFSLPQMEGDMGEPTPTPTPALGPVRPSSKTGLASYQDSPLPICKIAGFVGINIFDYQGHLSAWSPDGSSFAFIRPTNKLTWFVGDLVIASGSKFETVKQIAPYAHGRVFWSPDGKSLAFVSLRVEENIYTIMTVNRDGTGLTDLFPERNARTDDFSGKKTILSWPSDDRLHVMVSCGTSCTRALEISLPGGTAADYTPTDEEAKNAWSIIRNEPEYDTKDYPVMNEPNWSSDGRFTTFLDEKSYMWVLDNQEKTVHPLYMENMFPVYPSQPWARETHWSAQDLLAVRVDDHLEIYNPTCAKAVTASNP